MLLLAQAQAQPVDLARQRRVRIADRRAVQAQAAAGGEAADRAAGGLDRVFQQQVGQRQSLRQARAG